MKNPINTWAWRLAIILGIVAVVAVISAWNDNRNLKTELAADKEIQQQYADRIDSAQAQIVRITRSQEIAIHSAEISAQQLKKTRNYAKNIIARMDQRSAHDYSGLADSLIIDSLWSKIADFDSAVDRLNTTVKNYRDQRDPLQD